MDDERQRPIEVGQAMNKEVFKDWRVMLMLIFIILSVLSISPRTNTYLDVSYVEFNSSAWAAGIQPGMTIQKLNGKTVTDAHSFYSKVEATPDGEMIELTINKQPVSILLNGPLGLEVREQRSTNIRLGLDIQGGTRAIVKPITDSPSKNVTISTLEVLEARMNTYGLQEVKSKPVEDAYGNWYIQVELAGPGSERVLNVIKNVGRFDVRIRNQTILTGADIATVGAPQAQRQGGYGTPFTITEDAANSLQKAYYSASNTNQSTCIEDSDCPGFYKCVEIVKVCRPLIEMYLDDEVKFSAPSHAQLHESFMAGVPTQELSASVPDPDTAKNIEVVMRSGTLPAGVTGVEILSRDFVDPTLGRDFIRSTLIAAIVALAAVTFVVLFRYRDLKISFAIMITDIAEILILLGAAAFLRQDLDLPAIAGIIAAIGTGVDQQIIITDEILGKVGAGQSTNQRMKTAFFIVIMAALTIMATMLPLMTLGIGLVKGFAIMTFLGVLFGFSITRPAYAKIIIHILKK
ncbi:hypothetical protein ACFLQI_01115 [Candidatus Undinarchaeota archaeon]